MARLPQNYNIATSNFSISDIKSILNITTASFSVSDLFLCENLDGASLNSTYCPETGPLMLLPHERQLNNLQTKPYDIGKFRGYSYRGIDNNNFIKLQPIHYYHVYGNVVGVYYNGFPYWGYWDNHYGLYYPGVYYPGISTNHEQMRITVPANRLINIGYNLKSNIDFNGESTNQSIVIKGPSGTVLFSKTASSSLKINGSDIEKAQTVQRIDANWPSEPHWRFSWTVTGGGPDLFLGEYEKADDYSFFYNNTTSNPVNLFITFHGFSEKFNGQLLANHSSFIRVTINEDSSGNVYNCAVGTYYSYPRSHTFLYSSISGSTSYTLNMSGGNNLTSPVTDVDGLQFKVGYHINGVHQGHLSLTKVGTSTTSTIFNHIGNHNENYTFTTPGTIHGLYVHIAASQEISNHNNDYTGCKYTFRIT